MLEGLPKPDWPMMAAAAALFTLVAVSTLSASSYFLQFDNPVQHVAGFYFLRGEWAYTSNKALLMWIHASIKALFGPSPLVETVLLAGLGAAATAAIADLGRIATGSRRGALLTVLAWLGYGSVLYYLRIHIGFALAFFTLGVVLTLRRQTAFGAIMLLAAVFAHTSFSVPVGLWVIAVGILRPRDALIVVGVLVGGYLAYEAIALLYTGEIWHTAKNFLAEVTKLSQEQQTNQPVWYIGAVLRAGNGLLMVFMTAVALAALPFLPDARTNRPLLLIVGVAVVMLVAYGGRAALQQYLIFPRVLAGAFVGMSVATGWVLTWVTDQVKPRAVAALAISAVLIANLGYNALAVRRCSITPYPAQYQTIRTAEVPILYLNGNPWAASAFREASGATVLIDPFRAPLAEETRSSLPELPTGEPIVVIVTSPVSLEKTLRAASRELGVTISVQGPVTEVPGLPECSLRLIDNGARPISVLNKLRPHHEGVTPLTYLEHVYIFAATLVR